SLLFVVVCFLCFILLFFFFFFFFFQAEDGIRDLIVTGVQTCALPIFVQDRIGVREGQPRPDRQLDDRGLERLVAHRDGGAAGGRSEERRVGKEGRSRWSADH